MGRRIGHGILTASLVMTLDGYINYYLRLLKHDFEVVYGVMHLTPHEIKKGMALMLWSGANIY